MAAWGNAPGTLHRWKFSANGAAYHVDGGGAGFCYGNDGSKIIGHEMGGVDGWDENVSPSGHLRDGVNFWAEYFSNKGAGEALAQYRPFTSKDCDLWVSFAALRHIESHARGGKFIML